MIYPTCVQRVLSPFDITCYCVLSNTVGGNLWKKCSFFQIFETVDCIEVLWYSDGICNWKITQLAFGCQLWESVFRRLVYLICHQRFILRHGFIFAPVQWTRSFTLPVQGLNRKSDWVDHTVSISHGWQHEKIAQLRLILAAKTYFVNNIPMHIHYGRWFWKCRGNNEAF